MPSTSAIRRPVSTLSTWWNGRTSMRFVLCWTRWRNRFELVVARPLLISCNIGGFHRLPDRHVAPSVPLAQHDLPELQTARPECARRHQQVELPHPVKALAISLFVQSAIAGIEVLPPRH